MHPQVVKFQVCSISGYGSNKKGSSPKNHFVRKAETCLKVSSGDVDPRFVHIMIPGEMVWQQ